MDSSVLIFAEDEGSLGLIRERLEDVEMWVVTVSEYIRAFANYRNGKFITKKHALYVSLQSPSIIRKI